MDQLMIDFATRLLATTQGCRPDMHEPDEQGVSAQVIGDHLDNANGEWISETAILGKYQEQIVILRRESHMLRPEKFNLATLIAFARDGAAQALVERAKTFEKPRAVNPETTLAACKALVDFILAPNADANGVLWRAREVKEYFDAK